MADQFQKGVWHDYTTGQLMITLSKRDGNYFLSFLTVLVTVAGASAWTILSLLLHSYIVRSRKETDILDIQHQITLRNAKSPLGTSLDFIKLYRAWSKKKAPKLLLRTITILIPTVILYGGMVAASIFASKVAVNKDGGGRALARNQGCGILQLNIPLANAEDDSIRKNKVVNNTIAARNYAANFYSGGSETSSVRSSFITNALPYTANFAGPCPLKHDQRCSTLNKPISFESGPLNSHHMFGINAKESDRVESYASTTCALVNASSLFNSSSDNQWLFYWMGETLGSDPDLTFWYRRSNMNDSIGYQLKAYTDDRYFSENHTYWWPNEQLQSKDNDGDASLIFMTQNFMRYNTIVRDGLFHAEIPNGDGTYSPNSAANHIYCVDRYKMCNPVKDNCSPWQRYIKFFGTVLNNTGLDFNDVQLATAARLSGHMQQSNMVQMASNLNGAALYASSHVTANDQSTGLPDNQWHLEINAWFQTKLAMYQASVTDYIKKPSDLLRVPTLKPDDPTLKTFYGLNDGAIKALQNQCDTQLLMASTEIESFSLAGVLVIVIVSILLFLISLFMKDIMDFFGSFVSGSQGKTARESDEKLHVLRFAITSSGGPSDWDLTDSIPVTSQCSHVRWPGEDVAMQRYPSAEGLVDQKVNSQA